MTLLAVHFDSSVVLPGPRYADTGYHKKQILAHYRYLLTSQLVQTVSSEGKCILY